MNVFKLVEESHSTPDLVTIEGTVDTGFEFLALDECKEIFGQDVSANRTRGRIFFNIPTNLIQKVKELRSIDNLYVITGASDDLGYNVESKDDDLNKIKEFVGKFNIDKALGHWKTFMNFNGILYPSQEEHTKAVELKKKLKEKGAGDCQSDDNPIELPDILKFRVTCNRAGTHSFTSMEAACEFGGRLNDRYNWLVDLTGFDLEVVLTVTEKGGYVGFALTKESLHKRNITHFGPTTLRATICYNMMRLAEPKVGEIVVDPLCGGGSIPIEGALAYPNTFHIGGDIHEKAVSRSEMNCLHVRTLKGGSIPIDIFNWDCTKMPLKTASVDIFTTDLPFGKRSGRKADNRPLYTAVLKEMARVVSPVTGRAVLLTHDKKTLSQVLSRLLMYWGNPRPINVNLGGLDGVVFVLKRTSRVFV